jgi:site-specific recombinase XerD
MNNELIVIQSPNSTEALAPTLELNQKMDEKIKQYIIDAKAPNTIKSYRSDWAHYVEWCNRFGFVPLPAIDETVAKYLVYYAEDGLKTSTLQRRISAISQAHQAAGFESPTKSSTVRTVWASIRRKYGTQQKGKAPAVTDDIRAMVATLNDSLLGIRDRALLLIGFAGGFRRSEIVGLNVEDIEENRGGLVIRLRKSKTDQEGQGRVIGIPYGSNMNTCPVRSYQAWLQASRITTGPIFRSVNRHGKLQTNRLSDKAVALVVKRCAEAAGLDQTKYSGHSLRAGFATAAALYGKSERKIMEQTGHRSLNMVRRYIREGSLFNDNPAAGIGL